MPRAGFSLHSKQLQQRCRLPLVRHASSTAPPPKPRVLEKPDKFRPPSHPARIRSKPRYTYGPELTAQQKTKRYPHMMPSEGTFSHWFLTNRTIHVWITLSILLSLIFGIWMTDFLNSTPYLDLLPPNSMFFAHPFSFIRRWWEVYDMHVAYVSRQTAERRKAKIEDVQKRSDYRKAHGLEAADENKFGGWTVKEDPQVLEPGFKDGAVDLNQSVSNTVANTVQETGDKIAAVQGGEETYVDFEGKRQPLKKKWLGIW